MFPIRSEVPVRDLVKNPKDLIAYSDQELYKFLENIEDQPSTVLSCISAEILRRMLKIEAKIPQTAIRKDIAAKNPSVLYRLRRFFQMFVGR